MWRWEVEADGRAEGYTWRGLKRVAQNCVRWKRAIGGLRSTSGWNCSERKRGFSLIFPPCIDGLRTESIVKSPEASWFWAILIKLTTESTYGPLRHHYSRSRQQTLSPDFSCFLSHFLSLHLNHICLSSFQPISLSSLPPIPPPKKSWASLATAVGCLCVPYSIIKIDFLRRDLAAANRKIPYTATRYRSETVGRRYSRIKNTSLFSRYKLAQENSLLLNSNHEC